MVGYENLVSKQLTQPVVALEKQEYKGGVVGCVAKLQSKAQHP